MALTGIKKVGTTLLEAVRLHWEGLKKPTLLQFCSIFYFFWMAGAIVQEFFRFRAIGIDIREGPAFLDSFSVVDK